MPAVDSGIVTIYDRKNGNKPLVCHRLDAKEFLAHPSKRWSTDPNAENMEIKKAKGLKLQGDSGQAMLLKEMTLKQLQAVAKGKNIEKWEEMDRAALAEALEAIDKPQETGKDEQ